MRKLAVAVVALCSMNLQAANSGADYLALLLRPPKLVLAGIQSDPRLAADQDPQPDSADQMAEWWARALRDDRGRIDPQGLYRANLQRQAYLHSREKHVASDDFTAALLSPSTWTSRGPQNVGGRTRVIVADPDNPSTIFAGAVSGGLWKTTDEGKNWAHVTSFMTNIAVSALVFDTNSVPPVMYVGTGERAYGEANQGAGVFKSTDGGTTWTRLATTSTWRFVGQLAAASGVILAATDTGIWRCTDGTTFTRVYATDSNGFGLSVAFDPNDPTKAVASIISSLGTAPDYYTKIIYSSNAGAGFTVAAQPTTIVGRTAPTIKLAYAKSATHTIYASAGGVTALGTGEVWKSIDDGHNFSKISSEGDCKNDICSLWVNPFNADNIILGGVGFHRSFDGGASFDHYEGQEILSGKLHKDIHVIYTPPGYNGSSNQRAYAGTDGGVFFTLSLSTAVPLNGDWLDRNTGYQTTQYFFAAGDAGGTGTNGDVIGAFVGGLQDNGTLLTSMVSDPPRPATSARFLYGGDGGSVAIDPIDKQYIYGEAQRMELVRSTDGGIALMTKFPALPPDAGSDATTEFIAPFLLDPNESTTMLAGGLRLWRSRDIRAATPTWDAAIRPAGDAPISAIAVAKGNSNIIWVGQNDGTIAKSINGKNVLPDWTTIHLKGADSILPDRRPTSILIDPDDSDVVYITYGGYLPGNLWMTTNGGTYWSLISGSGLNILPSAPHRSIARHPRNSKALYVGTDVGIYESQDRGATWSTSQQGPDNVAINNVSFVVGADLLLAATHGRGLWTSDTSDVATYAPSNLSALATFSGAWSVAVSWNAYPGATSYQLQKKAGSADWINITVGGAGYTDTNVTAGVTYLYRVRAILSVSEKTGLSNIDLATTTTFNLDSQLDNTLSLALQLSELRSATNMVLTAVGLPTLSFAETPTAGVTKINASNLNELRLALTRSYRAIGKPDPAFTEGITAGTTKVKGSQFQETRNLVK